MVWRKYMEQFCFYSPKIQRGSKITATGNDDSLVVIGILDSGGRDWRSVDQLLQNMLLNANESSVITCIEMMVIACAIFAKIPLLNIA